MHRVVPGRPFTAQSDCYCENRNVQGLEKQPQGCSGAGGVVETETTDPANWPWPMDSIGALEKKRLASVVITHVAKAHSGHLVHFDNSTLGRLAMS